MLNHSPNKPTERKQDRHNNRVIPVYKKAAEAEIQIVLIKNEPLVSHIDLSNVMNVKPRSTMKLITQYQTTIETHGVVRFKIAKPPKGTTGGRPEQVAMLNEEQCFFILTLSRNTPQVVQAKSNLVKAFKAAREQLAQRQVQYLPLHHAAHDSIHAAVLRAHANGSTTTEALVHMNVEKLLNTCFGIAPNSRAKLSAQMQAIMSTAYSVVSDIYAQEQDHKTAYQRAKQQVMQLAALTQFKALGVPS